MKKLFTPFYLSAVSLVCGAVLLGLQAWLLATGIDDKNLIVTGHPAIGLSVTVTALAVVLLAAAIFSSSGSYRFYPDGASSFGEIAAAAALVLCGLELLVDRNRVFSVAAGIFGLLAGLSFVFSSFCAWKKIRLQLVFRIPGILFFILLLICRYQLWSTETQIYGYAFQLLALVCLMLATYQKTALEYTQGNFKAYLLFSRCAISFCLAAIPGSGQGIFFGAMAVWMLTDGFKVAKEGSNHEVA